MLVEVTEKKHDVIAEEPAGPGHKESLALKMLELVFEVLRQFDDVFLDDLRFIKPLVVRLSFRHEFRSFPEDVPTNLKNEP